jgi:predicted nucleic acid-binding protein
VGRPGWHQSPNGSLTPASIARNRADKEHAACRAPLEGDAASLVTTALVIAETAYLAARNSGRREDEQ